MLFKVLLLCDLSDISFSKRDEMSIYVFPLLYVCLCTKYSIRIYLVKSLLYKTGVNTVT